MGKTNKELIKKKSILQIQISL